MDMTTRDTDKPCVKPSRAEPEVPLVGAKWGWACRLLSDPAGFHIGSSPMAVGDLVAARVRAVRNHTRLVDRSGARTRLYPGDLVVGVLGHRYATDAFHGAARIEEGRAHLMTNAGLIGTVEARHAQVRAPTELEVLGSVVDGSGRAVNSIEASFVPSEPAETRASIVLVLGTGMNAGKTTAAIGVIRGLIQEGLSVAGLKVTGSVSPKDRSEMSSTGAVFVRDFSDYGFPSTYRLPEPRLMRLVQTMLADADLARPDVIVAEVADGVLQRETELLVRCLRGQALGAVLAAPCALSAMAGAELVEQTMPVLAVTGLISNAPLFGEELAAWTGRAVVDSLDDGRALARVLVRHVAGRSARVA
mgnify:CR=1 FL=1